MQAGTKCIAYFFNSNFIVSFKICHIVVCSKKSVQFGAATQNYCSRVKYCRKNVIEIIHSVRKFERFDGGNSLYESSFYLDISFTDLTKRTTKNKSNTEKQNMYNHGSHVLRPYINVYLEKYDAYHNSYTFNYFSYRNNFFYLSLYKFPAWFYFIQ